MTTEHLIRFHVRKNGREAQELDSLLVIAYDAAKIRKPDFGGRPSMAEGGDDYPADQVRLHFSVLADDEQELLASVQAVLNGLQVFEIEVVGDPDLLSARTIEPPHAKAAGVHYDDASKILTIDTWAPGWHDLEMAVFPHDGGRTGVMLASYEHGQRREEVFIVAGIKVLRPGGDGSPNV